MTKFLLLIFISLMIGCSFGKHTVTDKEHIEVSPAISGYSQAQKDIIAAIQSRNIQLLGQFIDQAKTSDLVFVNTPNTPMQAAIETDNIEAVELLIGKNVDVYNFGNSPDKFEKSLFLTSLGQIVSNRHLQGENSNESLRLLASHYYKLFQDAFDADDSKVVRLKLKGIRQKGMGCQVFEKYLALSLQMLDWKSSARNAGAAELQNFKCAYSKGDVGIQSLYESEMLNLVGREFKATSLASYLSQHKALLNRMVEIVPGVFLGPSLLYRISQSPEARGKNYEKPENLSEATHFLSNYGILNSHYEFIKVSDAQIEMAFRIFPRQPQLFKKPVDLMYLAIYKFAAKKSRVELESMWNGKVKPLQTWTENSIPYHEAMISNDAEADLHKRWDLYRDQERERDIRNPKFDSKPPTYPLGSQSYEEGTLDDSYKKIKGPRGTYTQGRSVIVDLPWPEDDEFPDFASNRDEEGSAPPEPPMPPSPPPDDPDIFPPGYDYGP